MINLSDCFSMVDNSNCYDVATSLGLQGIVPNSEISIPIYEIFYLKLLIGQESGFMSSNLAEFAALREICTRCGGITITLNIANMDALTLAGALLVSTPNTGMNVFIKLNAIDITDDTLSLVDNLADAVGIPVPNSIRDNTDELTQFVEDALQTLFDRLISCLQDNMDEFGIGLHEWDELPDFYTDIKESGEMAELSNYRNSIGAITF